MGQGRYYRVVKTRSRCHAGDRLFFDERDAVTCRVVVTVLTLSTLYN